MKPRGRARVATLAGSLASRSRQWRSCGRRPPVPPRAPTSVACRASSWKARACSIRSATAIRSSTISSAARSASSGTPRTRKNGLVPDRYPSPSFASIAAVGFGLTAYVIGVERGYVSRAQARLRTLRTLRFLPELPQGPDEAGMTGYNGFFYHFLDMENGQRFGTSELSTVDTALLLGGVLLAQCYFDRDTRAEREIRELAEQIYARVDWTWAQNRPPAISHGWRPETGFLRFDWRGYNEAHAALHPRARLADASGRARGVAGVDAARTRTTGASSAARSTCPSGRCSAISTPTSGSTSAASRTRYMREQGHRLLREQPPRRLRAARVRASESDALARLRQRDLGPDRLRRPGGHGADLQRRGARLLHVLGARHGRDACPRRRHDRADRGGRLDRVRAGDRDSDHPRVARALRRAPVSEVRLPGRVQSELHVHRRAAAARPIVEDIGWVAERLSRHRPGADRGDDRELPQRLDLEAHAAQSAHPPRPGARRLHRRLAGASRPPQPRAP